MDEDKVDALLGEDILEDMASRIDVFETIARDFDSDSAKVSDRRDN